MSNYNNEDLTFKEQQELLDIKNKYLNLKKKHDNLKSLVETTKRESTRLIGKASIIFWLSFFALAVMIGIEYPDFVDSGWFFLYLIIGIALFIVTILICSREHDNYATEEREVYQQMCKAKREYEKIQHRISDSSLIPLKKQKHNEASHDSFPGTSTQNDSIHSTSQSRTQPLNPSEFSAMLNSLRRTAPMVGRQDTSRLQALLKKYPEFADGQFCEFDFIDGKLRNVFKKNLPIEIKLELKRILPKNVYDEMNSRSNKQ